ncbi:DUF4143 domain-containing protein [Corynebacterium sp.]|uniref:DUF4143 domain-containing protein n=1 Tax=Corynebacterium sp. TaxID=1720 RepID=UPI003B3ABA16
MRKGTEIDIPARIGQLLGEFPVVVLQGARGSGVSTVAQQLADTHHGRVVSVTSGHPEVGDGTRLTVFDGFDDAENRKGLLTRVHAAAERTHRPGAFLLTSHTDLRREDDTAGWTVSVTLGVPRRGEGTATVGDAVAEVVDAAAGGPAPDTAPLTTASLAVGAHDLDAGGRRAFYRDHLTSLVTHDIAGVAHVEDPSRITAVLTALAHRGAGELTVAELAGETGIPSSTLSGYLDLLERLFTVATVPGWTAGLAAEEIQRPLAFLPDAGLVAYLDGPDDPLAHVLATLHRQSVWSREHYRVYHYRNGNGRCVDCVVELADGRVIGVQVTSDPSHLDFLRGELGDRFLAGLVCEAR